MPGRPLVMLATASDTTNLVYNGLGLDIDGVIIEDRQSEQELLRRRLKRLGTFTVAGQVLFRVLVVPLLTRSAHRRIDEIKHEFGLNTSPIASARITHVSSVNADETCARLQALNPAVVIVKGTRILSKRVLQSVPAKFVNMHTGITPRYRGVYGAYWALAEQKPTLCGVTIHLVDAGIDTGGVLAQQTIQPTPRDSILTYPYLQFAAGLPLLRRSVLQLMDEQVMTVPPLDTTSKLWSHPTLWEYLGNRLAHGVR